MEIINILKFNLINDCDYNELYFLGNECPGILDKVRNLLKKDYGFLDIVVDKDDISSIFTDLDAPNENARKIMIRDRFIKMFYQKLGIEDDELYYFNYLSENLKEKSLKYPNKQFRIHIMLDYVNDIDLQILINDMIADRCFYVFGYTTGNLLTYAISSGWIIEPLHDYRRFVNEEKIDKSEDNGFERTRIN